jgi:hypothetical protein
MNIINLISKVRRRLFCNKGKHNWEYCIAGNKIIEVEDGHTFADITMRYCKDCKRSEERLVDINWRESNTRVMKFCLSWFYH